MVRGSLMAVYLQTASLMEGEQKKQHRQREASFNIRSPLPGFCSNDI